MSLKREAVMKKHTANIAGTEGYREAFAHPRAL